LEDFLNLRFRRFRAKVSNIVADLMCAHQCVVQGFIFLAKRHCVVLLRACMQQMAKVGAVPAPFLLNFFGNTL